MHLGHTFCLKTTFIYFHLVNASRKIAFSAAAIEPQYGVEGVAQAVQFQDVIENIGEDFLVSNHTFVCSVPGWYYFTYR